MEVRDNLAFAVGFRFGMWYDTASVNDFPVFSGTGFDVLKYSVAHLTRDSQFLQKRSSVPGFDSPQTQLFFFLFLFL